MVYNDDDSPPKSISRGLAMNSFHKIGAIALIALSFFLTSPICAQRIATVPAASVPSTYLRSSQNRRLPNVTHLRRQNPAEYRLDAGDTLSVFIDGVLGPLDSNPPVQFPRRGSDLPPSLGYPVVVRENGMIDLPYVAPLSVRGQTIPQTRELIEKAYQAGETPILKSGKNRILVSLMRKRTYRVIVIGQEHNQSTNFRGRSNATRRSDQSATGNIINLPAGENDVLNALIRTGGMPGVNENSDIRVQRGGRTLTIPSYTNASHRNSEFPRSGSGTHHSYRPNYGQATTTIPTRMNRSQPFDRRQSELRNGDVLYVDSRRSEVYYTGGLLNGGQHLLPRDTDLDVLEAVAAVGRVSATGRNPVQPTELIVLRRLPGNRQVSIRVDLNRAFSDPRERILVAPGDTLLLRYKPRERAQNFGNSLLNTSVIGRLGR